MDVLASFDPERSAHDVQEPMTHFYGTDIGIRDPFGNHIRIAQLADAAPQRA